LNFKNQKPKTINQKLFLPLFMTVVLLSIVLIGLAFAGIAIRILLKKDGKFSGTCSSNNPLLQNENGTCGICGARPNEKCRS
jgi:hypothetical protein